MAAILLPSASSSLVASTSRRAILAQPGSTSNLPILALRRSRSRLGLKTTLRVSCSTQPESITQTQQVNEKELNELKASGFLEKAALFSAATVTPLLLAAEGAWAIDGELGILEGRSLALIHPLVMGVLFFSTLYAGFLGYQWRRVRELGDRISELKKQVPAAATEGAAAAPASTEIDTLTKERADLVKGNYREKHFNMGSLLLAFGVFIAVEGCVNTYWRTGRLFPGPHLWAGATITILWALAAALVPAMQKGNNTARQAHVALNALNVLLFITQIPTGLEIVEKVFEFTSWP